MTVDVGTAHQRDPGSARGYSVTVLAPLADPESRADLERPEAATLEVYESVARLPDTPSAQVVPIRKRSRPGSYGLRRRSVEMLDATTLEDVAAALGAESSRVVHAVGWEAGVVAAAVRQGSVTADGVARSVVVLEPLGAPGSPEWSLADHAAALVVQSETHRRSSLRHGIGAGLLHVVPPAAPRCPLDDPRELEAKDGPMFAVVGDAVGPVALEVVERVLRQAPDIQIVFAGAAGRESRGRLHARVVRSWPRTMSDRVHATAKVTWPLLTRVDAVLDASMPQTAPRAALAAMAAARPVLALGDGPAGEVVVDGQTGLRLGSDPARLAAGVCRVAADDAMVEEMGRAARTRWSTEHAPEVRARRLAEIYDLVAG